MKKNVQNWCRSVQVIDYKMITILMSVVQVMIYADLVKSSLFYSDVGYKDNGKSKKDYVSSSIKQMNILYHIFLRKWLIAVSGTRKQEINFFWMNVK